MEDSVLKKAQTRIFEFYAVFDSSTLYLSRNKKVINPKK
jgi:hypothetical protein